MSYPNPRRPNSESAVQRLRSLLAQPQPAEYFTDSCPGCRNWCGNRAGGRLLVCGMHPFGQPDCPDFESYDTIGDNGYPPELDRDPLHQYQPKVRIRQGNRLRFGSLLHRQHHSGTAAPDGWYYSVIVWDGERRSSDIAWLHESEVTLL